MTVDSPSCPSSATDTDSVLGIHSVTTLIGVGSIASIVSIGSIASVGSIGSISSLVSIGSIASVGSVGSVASNGKVGAIFNIPVAEKLVTWISRETKRRLQRRKTQKEHGK